MERDQEQPRQEHVEDVPDRRSDVETLVRQFCSLEDWRKYVREVCEPFRAAQGFEPMTAEEVDETWDLLNEFYRENGFFRPFVTTEIIS